MGDELMSVPESNMSDEHGNPAVAPPARAVAPPPPPRTEGSRPHLDEVNDGILTTDPRRAEQLSRRGMGDVHMAERDEMERRNARLTNNPEDTRACLEQMSERQQRENVGGAEFYRPTRDELEMCVENRGASRRAEAAHQRELEDDQHGAVGARQPGVRDMREVYVESLGGGSLAEDQADMLMNASLHGQEVPSPQQINTQRAMRNLTTGGPAMTAATAGMVARDIYDGEDVHSMTTDRVNEVAEQVAPFDGLLNTAATTANARQAGRMPQDGRPPSIVGIDGADDQGLVTPVRNARPVMQPTRTQQEPAPAIPVPRVPASALENSPRPPAPARAAPQPAPQPAREVRRPEPMRPTLPDDVHERLTR